jgi:hypothetical protein
MEFIMKYFALKFGIIIEIRGKKVLIRYKSGEEGWIPYSGRFSVGESICVRNIDGKLSLFSNIHEAISSIED